MAYIALEAAARAALARGVHDFAAAVGSTLGPGGRNVALASKGKLALTKDGVTVAREVDLADPFPAIGARMVRAASEAVAKGAGDGTTTVAVLTDAILQGAHRLVVGGFNPILLSRIIRELALDTCRALQQLRIPCRGREALFRIALIAANGDEEVANLVADALEQAGSRGIVTIEDGKRTYCSLRVVAGARYPTGWASPDFVTEGGRQAVTLQNPYILLAETHLHPMEPFFPILEQVYSAKRPLLVVCLSISGPALKTLTVNLKKKTLEACAVHAPYFSDIASDTLRDLAALTGATVYSPYTGRRFQSLTLQDLGEARSVTVTKTTTTLICDSKRPEVIVRIGQLERQIEREASDHEKQRLRERLSKLAGAVSILEVGGNTETELKERRDRIDDALHAARGAMEHGILPGGGLALLQAAHRMEYGILRSNAKWQELFHAALRMMREACAEPMRRIVRNAGGNADHVVAQVRAADYRMVYDAKTWQLVDPMEAGIHDPAQVPMLALAKAAETAALILNAGAVVFKEGKKR